MIAENIPVDSLTEENNEVTKVINQLEKQEKVIYVIVTEAINLIGSFGKPIKVYLPPGRIIAQAVHVVSKMRLHEAKKNNEWDKPEFADPVTTIILSVRNSRELLKIGDDLLGLEMEFLNFSYYNFYDIDYNFYGDNYSHHTAICTSPVTRGALNSALGYLELYKKDYTQGYNYD